VTTRRPDPRAGPPRRARLRFARDAARAWLLAAALAGCSAPGPLAPQSISAVRLEGRAVTWTTAQPALGTVRWGTVRSHYDRVAYPDAAVEREPVRTHRVTLLGAAAGESVFVQALARGTDGTITAGASAAFLMTTAAPAGPRLVWTMIDVGFGDAHLLTMPAGGFRVLIDAGERRDAVNVARFLDDSGIGRLDAVLATHAHEDHIGGLVGSSAVPTDGVLERFEIALMLEGPPPSAYRPAHAEMVSVSTARGIPRAALQSGDDDASTDALAWDPEVRVRILHAGGGRALGGDSESDWINNDSVVLRIVFGDVAMSLGGDAESPATSAVIASGATLTASLLKVHHHGAADASDAVWLDAVRPRAGLIPILSYEATAGSLPSSVVLERLRERNVDVYALDRAEPLDLRLHGDAGQNVTVTTDGVRYEIRVAPSASIHWAPAAPALSERSQP
jgi:beta-lactamase superfamily II metal-dependent hydrolase